MPKKKNQIRYRHSKFGLDLSNKMNAEYLGFSGRQNISSSNSAICFIAPPVTSSQFNQAHKHRSHVSEKQQKRNAIKSYSIGQRNKAYYEQLALFSQHMEKLSNKIKCSTFMQTQCSSNAQIQNINYDFTVEESNSNISIEIYNYSLKIFASDYDDIYQKPRLPIKLFYCLKQV